MKIFCLLFWILGNLAYLVWSLFYFAKYWTMKDKKEEDIPKEYGRKNIFVVGIGFLIFILSIFIGMFSYIPKNGEINVENPIGAYVWIGSISFFLIITPVIAILRRKKINKIHFRKINFYAEYADVFLPISLAFNFAFIVQGIFNVINGIF